MRLYIENLTNHLISKHGYDGIFERFFDNDVKDDKKKFIEHIKFDLGINDVREMSPAKLGEIMCAFEVADVMASKQDLFVGATFSGSCEELLRELVSLCLAYAIEERLAARESSMVPPYQGRIPGFRSSFRRVLGEIEARQGR